MKTNMNDPQKAKEYFRAKLEFTTGPVEVSHMLEQGNENINVIDVRDADSYAKGHVPGAVNLPEEKWRTFAGLRKDKLNIPCCYSQTCHLAATAAVEFATNGFPVMEMEGGFEAWKANDLQVEESSESKAA
jgi:rhodanese-related sulfurtransferase